MALGHFFYWLASFTLKEAKSSNLQFKRIMHILTYSLLRSLFWFHVKCRVKIIFSEGIRQGAE